MTSKTFLAALAGGVVNFLLGYVIFNLALGSFYAAHAGKGATRAAPDMIAIGLGCLVFGFLLAFIFAQWAGIKTALGGARGGAIIGGIAGLAFALWRLGGTYVIDGYLAVFVDTIAMTVLSAATGAIVGMILGKDK